jgi:hypothetical protein
VCHEAASIGYDHAQLEESDRDDAAQLHADSRASSEWHAVFIESINLHIISASIDRHSTCTVAARAV